MKRIRKLLLLSLLCIILTPCLHAQAAKIKGIDVSRWQGSIGWEKVSGAGIKFAMVGMGRYYADGTYMLDPQFETNMKGAAENGIHTGVYLYSLAKTKEQAIREATWVIRQIQGFKISYPVAFDMEDPSVQSLGKAAKTEIALAFMETVKRAGYYPMMYASESWFKSGIDTSKLSGYDFWVARWSTGMTFTPVSIWQHSNKGKIDGISGDVDLDISYVNYAKKITPRTKAEDGFFTAHWETIGSKYRYYEADGTYPVKTFKVIGKKTYFFNKNGYRVQAAWKKIKGKYYYFGKKGVLRKGWVTVKGVKYFCDKKTGARLSGWLTIGKKTWFLQKKTGAMQTGWKKLAGRKYFFHKKTGVMQKGWKKIAGKWYFFDKETGVMQKDCKIGRYILGADGVCTNR